jgi:cation/acetate symporter
MIVISSSLAHDIYGEIIKPQAPDRERLLVGRLAIFGGLVVAGLLGIYPPGFVAEVVAFAFGLAAASFFPILVLGVFWKRCNRQGAIAGLLTGLVFTLVMIVLMRAHVVLGGALSEPILDSVFGINAQGIGIVGMGLNFVVTYVVTNATPPPPEDVQRMVEQIRYPRTLTDEELRESSPST